MDFAQVLNHGAINVARGYDNQEIVANAIGIEYHWCIAIELALKP